MSGEPVPHTVSSVNSMAVTTTSWANTLIGPLTTTFIPPSTCISDIWVPNSTNQEWLNLGPTSIDQCLPSGWGPSAYYSPARCPSGYSAHGISTADSETHAVCCPSYAETTYVLRPQTSSKHPWYSTELCQTQPLSGTTTFPVTIDKGNGVTQTSTGILGPDGLINAYGISIRWKDGDFPASTTATPTVTDLSGPSGDKANGLSGGAKAGIGVGVALGALLVIGIAVAFFLFQRRRRQDVEVGAKADEKHMGEARRHELAYEQGPHELSSRTENLNQRGFMKPQTEAELPASMAQVSPLFELDGSGR
ncbi:hypothetical protein N7456_010633 [Penicillium angulare]|uniref:Uncharacterized protein n=1 Tax=Penicillium angulare TaxID=116970 RepID=A0A9W9K790_9EURO|nr:hypothetical protein N7456_010633 [Penicillium angulare]